MITAIIKEINTITPIIKNKYISYDDLNNLISNMELFLKMAITSKNSMLSDLHVGLDVIFPAIDHLKLFLGKPDLGAIALVSKTLYDLMIKQFTQVKTDIFILQHYITNKNYDHDVNVNFVVNGQQVLVPINASAIAHKKLRILIGHTKYLKLYKKVGYSFFKDDFIYNFYKGNKIKIYDSILCIFCQKLNFYHSEHLYCAFEYHNNAEKKYPEFEKITTFVGYNMPLNNICPELEYLAIENLKINMPSAMKYSCKGVYNGGKNNTCSKCGIKKHIHDIYVEKK